MTNVVVTSVRVPRAGDLLVATPRLVDPNFDRTVVFVISHQPAGTLGVVINRSSDVSCAAAVPRWAPHFSEGSAVGLGGPVEPGGLLALGTTFAASDVPQPLDESDAGSAEGGGVWRSVTPRVGLVDLSADPSELDAQVAVLRIYGGHAGWGPAQLLGELEAGCWWVFDAVPADLTADTATLWHDVLARQRAPVRLLSQYPEDPSLN